MEDLTLRFSENLTKNTKTKSAETVCCDKNSATTLSLNNNQTKCISNSTMKRNLNTDFFTILLLVYHMVQWFKVTRTNGQSHQDDEEY